MEALERMAFKYLQTRIEWERENRLLREENARLKDEARVKADFVAEFMGRRVA